MTNVKEKELYDITYRKNLKIHTNEPTSMTETQSQIWKANVWLPVGKVSGRGINLELEIGIQTLTYRK